MKSAILAAAFVTLGGACATAGQGPAEPGPTVIELDMAAGGGRPLVEVSAGDAQGRFILDTGAAFTVVLSSFAEAAGARRLGPTSLNSPLGGEPMEAEQAEIDDVVVADFALGAVTATVIADDAFPMPGGAVGVLPIAALNAEHVVELDFAAGSLTMADEPQRPVRSWTPRAPDARIIETTLVINGVDIVAHLDTGSPGRVMLPIGFAEALGLDDQLALVGRMRTVDAEREVYEAPFEGTVEIAGAQLSVDALQFADLPAANVGVSALGALVLVLDRGGERFAFRQSDAPARAEAPGPVRRVVAAAPGGSGGRLGLRAMPADDHIAVAGTDAGSRAERAGLLEGDKIVAVNDVAIAEIQPADLMAAMRAAPVSFTVERDGERLEIDVPDR